MALASWARSMGVPCERRRAGGRRICAGQHARDVVVDLASGLGVPKRNRMNRIARALMVVSIMGCPPVLLAQSEDSKPAEAVLSGPKVEAKAQARTLVERDETGHVKRLDIPPAEAALKLLELDDATKEKAQAILDKRAAILDKIVKENLLLLVELSNATR